MCQDSHSWIYLHASGIGGDSPGVCWTQLTGGPCPLRWQRGDPWASSHAHCHVPWPKENAMADHSLVGYLGALCSIAFSWLRCGGPRVPVNPPNAPPSSILESCNELVGSTAVGCAVICYCFPCTMVEVSKIRLKRFGASSQTDVPCSRCTDQNNVVWPLPTMLWTAALYKAWVLLFIQWFSFTM